MIETYKYQHNVYDIDNEWLKPETSTVTRGHTRKLIKPRCNSTLRLHCFSHRVVNHCFESVIHVSVVVGATSEFVCLV